MLEPTPFPVNWHKRVVGLAVPIVLANLTQPLLSAVDTAVAGHLPSAASLGGVAIGGLFFGFVFWGFSFLRMGTTGLAAQAFGAGDGVALRATLLRALGLAVLIGTILLAGHAPLVRIGLDLLGGGGAVHAAARAYCMARIWSAPAALANYAVLGYLLGRQRAVLGLALQGFVNLVNVAAVLAYVYGFGWGVAGIGAATATADWLGLALGMVFVVRLADRGLPPVDWRGVMEGGALRRLVTVNRDIFLRTMCLLFAFGWFTHCGAVEGDLILAANAVLFNFQMLMSFGLDGIAQAAEALVGAAVGARDGASLRAAIRVSLFWSLVTAAVFAAGFMAAGPLLIAGLTDQPPIRLAALDYLPWLVASPLISVWCFLLDGVFIGATRTRELRDSVVIAMAVFMAAAAILRPLWGNHGLWLALMLLMFARGATLGAWLGRIERDIYA